MLGVEYIAAFIKIAFNIAFAIITAIPLRIAWNCVAANYLAPWLPDRFEHLPYWHVVAFILVCTFVGELIQKLTPKIVSVEQSNTNNSAK